MKTIQTLYLLLLFSLFHTTSWSQARNPIIFADVPDNAIIRVGKDYYMSSTTMHMNPGLPIMKSKDLVNWENLNYAYDILEHSDVLDLVNDKNTYGRGSWASSFRYHKGVYYVTTFAQTTNKTYIFKTKDINKGKWERVEFAPAYHDHTLVFDENDKAYLIYGGGQLKLVELNDNLTGVREGTTEKVVIENATAPAGPNVGLPAEGSQLFYVNGKYYMFNIAWPRGGMRTVIVHRADKLTGPWEGKVAFADGGVAQGGLIDTPDGKWFAYLFQDYGAVGRIPFLVPVKWEDGWPVIGENGKLPTTLDLPANKSLIPGIVNSDEFTRKKTDAALPLVWQWNHNPDNSLWSVTERKGFLRLKTGRIENSFVQAKNTLTQRTIGPKSSGSVSLDVSNLKDGDFAGLSALQKDFGQVGVKVEDGKKYIVMVNAKDGKPEEIARVALEGNQVFLKVDCDFTDKRDIATFAYSLNGKDWTSIGNELKMVYSIPHFMGYRYGLFNYATKQSGGYADFDWFRITE